MAKGYYGNAEAVVFNQAPFYNLFLREQQQKKLENQMVDKQISDDMAKLSPEGMRQQDMEPFLKGYQNLKNLAIQYKDAIRNPAKNPKVYQEYQNNKARLMGLVAESKAAKENTKSLYNFRSQNLDKLDDDAFKQAMVMYNAPIGTPEHDQTKNFDQSQLVFKAPKMDLAKVYGVLEQVKPEVSQTNEPLSTGQSRNIKTSQRNPQALAERMGLMYDSDTFNVKKGFNDLFNTMPQDQIGALEDYAKSNFDSDFQIKTPKDLAIASGLYGRADKNTATSVSGSPYLSNQAFQRSQQQRSFSHQEAMDQKRADRKADGDYLWENDIASALKSGDTENVRRLASRLETSTPGAERIFLKEGQTTQGAMNTFKRELKIRGLDGKTKTLKPEDFKAGVLVVAVPKSDKDGNRLKNKSGQDEYEYLAVSARDQYLQSRLNKLKSYAAGTSLKGLPDKSFKQQPATQLPTFQLNEFSPIDDEEDQ